MGPFKLCCVQSIMRPPLSHMNKSPTHSSTFPHPSADYSQFLSYNLRYFFVSYVKILRFYQKFFLIGPLLGEVRIFRVVLGLRGMKKNFELGKIYFFPSIMYPKYDLILVFWKFNQLNAPWTTLCVDLGSKCQIIFPLVWD